jgi:hypothetical protein
MRTRLQMMVSVCLVFWAAGAVAVPKPHVIAFGKWTPAKWYAGGEKPLELKIRGLYVDTRLKEYTTGLAHEVTDRLFVVRRAFRLNDILPTETGAAPRWQWERGGWLLVDRLTGRVSQIKLPGVRSLRFHGKLVSGLHRLLRCVGRWQEAVCDRGSARAAKTDPEKAAGRARRRR